MYRKSLQHVLFLIVVYLCLLFLNQDHIFSYRFDSELIRKYFSSQDIPHETPEKRVFLSDAQIYEATGYLYSSGYDPSKYNFEHPPLIKYLYGFSTQLFNSFFPAQLSLGVVTITSGYVLFYALSKRRSVAFFSSLLLLSDPLFLDVSSNALLDMGQTAFMLLYFYAVFFKKKNYLAQGVSLALFAGCKFWITPLFFISLFALYHLVKKEFDVGIFIKHLLVAFIVYSLFYTKTFIITDGRFNIIWHILKTFKYRLQHNTNSVFGASFILFLTGFVKQWWGANNEYIKTYPWSFTWPLALVATIAQLIKLIKKQNFSLYFLTAFIPVGYLFYIATQIPFPRYFLIILPFVYLIFVDSLYQMIHIKIKK